MLFFCWEKDKNSALPPPYVGAAEKQTSAHAMGTGAMTLFNSDSRSVLFVKWSPPYAAQVV